MLVCLHLRVELELGEYAVMRLFDSFPAVGQSKPTNLQYEHVVSLPLLPGAFGPLASHLFFHPTAMPARLPARAQLQLKAADMISHSLINWENQSRGGGNCY